MSQCEPRVIVIPANDSIIMSKVLTPEQPEDAANISIINAGVNELAWSLSGVSNAHISQPAHGCCMPDAC